MLSQSLQTQQRDGAVNQTVSSGGVKENVFLAFKTAPPVTVITSKTLNWEKAGGSPSSNHLNRFQCEEKRTLALF